MAEETRYVLAKKIARGGMAEIYLGKHIGEDGFQRLCVLKRILPHYSQDKEFIQMFRDEAHICKRLQHANIVRVEGFEEVDGSYAIIMEFVDGTDLRNVLHACEQAQTRPTIAMACHIIAEAARGLHYAHTKVDEITNQPLGIVHRDISPQNILISYEGEVKVTDFGIADAESKLTETRPGIVKGKYSYMSPEQISAKNVDARTDIFALGIVLWEMLAMRRLFQGENEVDTIQLVKNCKIDKELRDLNPEVDDELDQIVKKSLAKDPRRRYRTAAEFEKDLRRYLSRRYPDFTPDDLGNFLKSILDKKRAETAQDIKRTLTETNLKGAGTRRAGRRRSIDLSFEEGSGPALSLARPTTTSLNKQPGALVPVTQSGLVPVRTGSGFGRPSYTRGTGTGAMHTRAFSRRGKERNNYLLLSSLAAVVLVAGLALFRVFNAKETPPVLVLRSQPARVIVKIDDTVLAGGRYVNASTRDPLKLKLKPGRHTVVVSRPGYAPYRYVFDAEPGDVIQKTNIVLRERTRIAKVIVRMRPSDKPIRIDINNGYFQAVLVPGKRSAVAPDLHYGKEQILRVYPSMNSTEGSFRCKFTPKALDWRQKNVVTIDPEKKTCTVKGPAE